MSDSSHGTQTKPRGNDDIAIRAVQVDLHAEPLVIRDGHRVDHDPHALSPICRERPISTQHVSYYKRPLEIEGQFLSRDPDHDRAIRTVSIRQ